MRRSRSRTAHTVNDAGPGRSPLASGGWAPRGAAPDRGPGRLHVLSEAEFQQRILDYCRLRGLRVFFDIDSRKKTAGWPDLTIMSTDRVLFRELKTDRGKLRPEQETCIATMQAAGLDVAVWRPSGWTDHVIPQLDAMKRPRRLEDD